MGIITGLVSYTFKRS